MFCISGANGKGALWEVEARRHNENVSGEEIMRNCCSSDKELREKLQFIHSLSLTPFCVLRVHLFLSFGVHSPPCSLSLSRASATIFSMPLLWVPVLAHAVSYTKCYLVQQAPLEWKILITRAHCRSFPTNSKDAELPLSSSPLSINSGGICGQERWQMRELKAARQSLLSLIKHSAS